MTAVQTGSGLRSRKVDPKKTMAILRFDQVDDLDESSLMNTAIPLVATGVEKEEEEEHHLQQALVANQTKTQVVIPTPDASGLANLPNYHSYYTPTFHLPKSLIKYSALAEEVIGCLYNLNERDLEWLESLSKDIRDKLTDNEFEILIYNLDEFGSTKVIKADKVSGEPPSFEEFMTHMNEQQVEQTMDESIIKLVCEYWKDLRYFKKDGSRLRPILKSEHMSANPENDPYVCFRQREIKSMRKVRRSDTLALDKIRKLKEDMVKVKNLLDLVKDRELARRELISVEHAVFNERVYVRRLRKHFKLNIIDHLDSSPDTKQRKKARKRDESIDSTKIRIPMQNLKDATHLVSDVDTHLFDDGGVMSTEQRIFEKIKREKALNEKSWWYDCTEFPYKPTAAAKLWGKHLGIEGKSSGHVYTRRRIGRGGRVLFDRFAFPGKGKGQDSGVCDFSLLDPQEVIMDKSPEPEAFQIQPRDEQYVDLQNRPLYSHQFDPTKADTTEIQIPQIVRMPINPPSTVKKKNPKPLPDVKPSTNSTKKKAPDVLDARTQAVKTMMKQAVKQAQQTQAQMQMQQTAQTSPTNINSMQQKLMFQQQQMVPQISPTGMTGPSGMPMRPPQNLQQFYFSQMQQSQMMNTPTQNQMMNFVSQSSIPQLQMNQFMSHPMMHPEKGLQDVISLVDETAGIIEKVEGMSDKENLLDTLLA